MAKVGRLVNSENGTVLLDKAVWCSSFFCKLRGLMFRSHLEPGEGLLMVEPWASRSGTSIHMLFMGFPIATIWMDETFSVVDKVLAKPWALAYVPSRPAKYTLEAAPELLNRVAVGDTLAFEPSAS
jgi:uncharacterized protein